MQQSASLEKATSDSSRKSVSGHCCCNKPETPRIRIHTKKVVENLVRFLSGRSRHTHAVVLSFSGRRNPFCSANDARFRWRHGSYHASAAGIYLCGVLFSADPSAADATEKVAAGAYHTEGGRQGGDHRRDARDHHLGEG